MLKWSKVAIAILLAVAVSPVLTVMSQADSGCDYYGTHSDGALYCITMPEFWSGDLVIFAHGYVPVSEPLDIAWDQMTFPDDMGGFVSMTDLLNGLGFAFATTSYSENGLAVQQGIVDILDLVEVFDQEVGTPAHIYLVGASEGGLITTLAIERHPEAFTGGLATCGPIGDFQRQVNYWGDFRVVFDYFMDTPDVNVLPGTATHIPRAMMDKWDSKYVPIIGEALVANPLGAQQLISVTEAPVEDPLSLYAIGDTTVSILWYNMRATNDAVKKLGGPPLDNWDRVYTGSFDDDALNDGVKRFKAKPAAMEEIANYYETTGVLTRPMVTVHTLGDPIIPYWHQTLYAEKVALNSPYTPFKDVTINRYGHCTFMLPEVLQEFGALIYMSTGEIPPWLPLP